MNRFKIVNSDGITFKLFDEENNKTHSIMLQFFDVEMPSVGDTILLDPSLLDVKSEKFAQPLCFAPFVEENKKLPKDELAGIVHDGNKIVLNRVFG